MLRFALATVFIFFLIPIIPADAAVPTNAVGTITISDLWFGEFEACSVWAVRPMLLVTAAHCASDTVFGAFVDGGLGQKRTVTFYRGVSKHQMQARIVWNSFVNSEDEGLDLAFLVPDKPWPVVLSLASLLPKKGGRAEHLSFALGIRRWAGYGTFDGLYDVNGLGWMLIYRSDYGAGGASGSPVMHNGKVVGVHTHGYAPLKMSLVMPVGRIRRALRELDKDRLTPVYSR